MAKGMPVPVSTVPAWRYEIPREVDSRLLLIAHGHVEDRSRLQAVAAMGAKCKDGGKTVESKTSHDRFVREFEQ